MTPEDAARWGTARTLGDLGLLTVAWLAGEIAETPTHMGPPMPETKSLIPVLTAVNRAGFVTENSQPGVAIEPGVAIDADSSAQRATVTGFAADDTFRALTAALADADLLITAGRATREENAWGPDITVTLVGGEPCTWDGGVESRSELEYHHSLTCHPDAIAALCEAWQITIVDPQWGRNDLLWPLLEAFAASRWRWRPAGPVTPRGRR